MYVKRSSEDKAACLLEIRTLMQSKGWKMYEDECRRYQNAIAEGMFRESGENLAKSAGVIRGINLALNIDDFLVETQKK